MLTLSGTLKSIFGWRTTTRRSSADRRQAAQPTAERGAQVNEADEEQVFLASIAGLSAQEREKRIARREWYRQLAERQDVMEAEYQAERNLWK